ncbi:MAG: hypothetical protein NTX24_04815 [Candidatus Pacearchaeota archaeon]|nr:hypothetical protein [Candidatus Pacearchaeota archaeon]
MKAKVIKEFFKAKAFTISVVILLLYAIFFHGKIIIDKDNLEHIFGFFLTLFPLIIAIFTILISFTDNKFLKFLKDTKGADKKTSIYDEILAYFIINTILSLIAVLIAGFVFCFKLSEYAFLQYIMIFVFSYTIISFIQLIRFIFYFAKKKADFVSITEKTF